MIRVWNWAVPLVLTGVVFVSGTASAEDEENERQRDCYGERAIVIGHRGASGYRPEHTLASYALAIEQGADYIEPDLVSTKDSVLVARHENEISGTTDVADHPEFAVRRSTKVIDGTSITGWFTEDFTLAELKTLRAKERLPELRPQNTGYDGKFAIPTLEEVLELARAESHRRGCRIGVYPETKHPTYFQQLGLELEKPLVKTLRRHGLNGRNAAVFIQSFEVANLKKLSHLTRVPLVQLIDQTGKPYDFVVSNDPRSYADLVQPAELAKIAKYARGVGVNKALVAPRDAAGGLLPATTLIADAHRAGLIVHAWTFRRENNFLPLDFRVGNPSDADYLRQPGDLQGEIELFLGLGLDGFFTDNPDIGVDARDAVESEALPSRDEFGASPLQTVIRDVTSPEASLSYPTDRQPS